jgi:hypothetical protein
MAALDERAPRGLLCRAPRLGRLDRPHGAVNERHAARLARSAPIVHPPATVVVGRAAMRSRRHQPDVVPPVGMAKAAPHDSSAQCIAEQC